MTVSELGNFICQYLPEKWEIVLEMEHGSGSWRLYRDGNEIPYEDVCSVDTPFENQPLQMLEHALNETRAAR